MKIAYSFGIIDILHYGHIRTLLAAKKDADLHVFGLVSDEAAVGWLGTVVSSYDERLHVLEQVSCVDMIMPQKSLDPVANLRELHEKYPYAQITLYHGNDWKILPAARYLESIHGKTIFTEYYTKMSPGNILTILTEQASSHRVESNLISTKANTLHELADKLSHARIEDMLIVTVGEIDSNPHGIYQRIQQQYQGSRIVVRSSSSNEDCYESSNAGHYESVLNIDSSDETAVQIALKNVAESYGKDLDNIASEQILIQTMTKQVRASGVVFTRDIHANLPYYLINYDESGSTDSVTSGAGGRSLHIARDISESQVAENWRGLIAAVKEIEDILEGMVLDIEFAIQTDGQVVIFQVRPLAANYRFIKKVNDHDFFAVRDIVKKRYCTNINKITGRNMFLSDMAFWNPAEMIGDNPRNLDYSLYREIITKKAWNEGLIPMGYRSVPDELMYKVGNKPYICLEYAFLALMPSSIHGDLADKLLHYYEQKLKARPSSHDKIEFEIVFSCYDFETESAIKDLLVHGFSLEEMDCIKTALYELTQKAVIQYHKVLETDREALEVLKEQREAIEKKIIFGQENIWQLLQYFRKLLGDIQKYGTPQFSRQARYAFIARAFCTSLVSAGYFTQVEMDTFLSSLHTVASDFGEDISRYTAGKMKRSDFYEKYGHLRSGTYDIRTERYDNINFSGTATAWNGKEKRVEEKVKTDLDQRILSNACTKLGFGVSADEFVLFIKRAIEQREYFKFEFTKSLSLAIEILALAGQKLGISRRKLSYLEITDILASEYYGSELQLAEFWEMVIGQRECRYKDFSKVVLPEIIMNVGDIDQVAFGGSRPNFVTDQVIEAETELLDHDVSIKGKIVLIPKADPGYDWIFTKGIAGLVTEYGGAASHMAIRCAEFSIPAAIGCGKKVYEDVSLAKRLRIDGKERRLLIIE